MHTRVSICIIIIKLAKGLDLSYFHYKKGMVIMRGDRS